MLERVSLATFAEHVGTKFQLHFGGQAPLEVELVHTTALGFKQNRPAPLREPFSLIFRSHADFYLPQRIYQLEHIALGTLEIFLVPIEPDEHGMRYEAVFN
jgi:hypothetical protein